jgi:TRAP-type mannitol/chloroaromatic compound transport system permease small subunit
VRFLLGLSRLIDRLNEAVGKGVYWLILVSVLISSGNATVRYALSRSSNGWLEIQWYLFSAVFLLGAGYTLLHNEHVRIDILYGRLKPRTRAWIDLLGGLFFLLPMAIVILTLAWPMFLDSWVRDEYSTDAGGLLRWPVKLLIPVGFLLLSLQGVSEVVKRAAFLAGLIPDPGERPSRVARVEPEADAAAGGASQGPPP